jgi:glycine hydroxymethyltransferase
VPYDKQSPFVTSGIRIGTPAMTSRGMKEDDMKFIAGLIDKVVMNFDKEDVILSVKKEVKEFTSKFPLYKD